MKLTSSPLSKYLPLTSSFSIALMCALFSSQKKKRVEKAKKEVTRRKRLDLNKIGFVGLKEIRLKEIRLKEI